MSQVTFDFRDTSVVITGGARGIGAGIGALFAASGADVSVWDREPAAFAGSWEPSALLTADVTDERSLRDAMDQTLRRVGKVDVVVSSAGITGPVGPLWDYDADAWRRVVDLDLTGAFLTAKTVVPHLRERGYGRVITVASIAGKEATASLSAYTAAKHGVVGMTKVLARELIADGVTVNAIAPVMVRTELFSQLTDEFIERTRALIPMGRFLTVEEVAATVAWIASDQCGFTTGATFDLSGGRADY
ncbi:MULTISPECIES: SDR family NAD(P)-dependent oxidoreductase [Microbacterium]|uniref:3-oxoacyl-ACP reductase n=1 Tax=Microbacterium hominis TaxID=162426 RepID=A0A2K9DT31_9MICO|nr:MULTISPECIES: SDR family NAD(P)-dependent oxidoreductase [Microbacterium]AUG29014.1 3-oxoacyl-ACP reductase [Microbacterium hominis]